MPRNISHKCSRWLHVLEAQGLRILALIRRLPGAGDSKLWDNLGRRHHR